MAEEMIGRYRIIRKLGSGGMGDVFVAHDPRFRRDIALKLLPDAFLQQPILRERFEREAQTIAKLEHPAIVPVHDYGEYEGKLYLVMRLMPGGTLRDRLKQGPLAVEEASAILTRISSALDKAHEAGVIHRDLKPANILFDDEGRPYLSDFGIVKVITADTLTAEHALLGTPRYMSPEQALADSELDRRSDIYSLGAVVFEMLTGNAPYTATSPIGVAMKHITAPVPSLRKARPDLPPELATVLERAMAKEKDQRFATAGGFARAFEAAARGEAPSAAETVLDAAPAPAGTEGSDGRSRSRRAALLGGAGLVLCAAFSVWALFGLGDQPLLAMLSTETATVPATPTAPTPTETPAPATATPSITPETPTPTTPTETALPPAATATPAPTGLPPTIIGDDGLEMVLVPAGEFIMGSTSEQVQEAVVLCRRGGDNDPCAASEFENEMPQRRVYLNAYYVDITEVTNAHYKACVNAGDCAPPADTNFFGNPLYDNYPVVWVSWFDARNYCRAVGERLPTEAEWEKAARGEDGRVFPWGDSFDGDRANTEEEGGDRLTPVGRYPSGASPYGLLDLAGSAWEWVNDWFDPDYYEVAPDANPPGPASGSAKVLRGGSYANFAHYARTMNRGFRPPGDGTQYRGFRCVVSADTDGP